MRRRNSRIAVACVVGCGTALVACASTTGVREYGPSTYMVTGRSELSPNSAENAALDEATKYCRSSNGYLRRVSSQHGSALDSFGDRINTYDLTFSCSSGSDAPSTVGAPAPATGGGAEGGGGGGGGGSGGGGVRR